MVMVEPVRQCLLCLYGSSMAHTSQYFVKGPGNPYAEVVLSGCSGVQGSNSVCSSPVGDDMGSDPGPTDLEELPL